MDLYFRTILNSLSEENCNICDEKKNKIKESIKFNVTDNFVFKMCDNHFTEKKEYPNDVEVLIEYIKNKLFDENIEYSLSENDATPLCDKFFKYRREVNIFTTIEDFSIIVEYITKLKNPMNHKTTDVIRSCLNNYGFFPSVYLINILKQYLDIVGRLPTRLPNYILNKNCMKQNNMNIRVCNCLNMDLMLSFMYLNKSFPTENEYIEFMRKNDLIERDPEAYEEKYKMKTPTKNLTNLITRRFNSNDEKDNCSICLNEFCVKEKIVTLPCCDKMFHDSGKCSVRKWLKENRKCPLCNREVKIK